MSAVMSKKMLWPTRDNGPGLGCFSIGRTMTCHLGLVPADLIWNSQKWSAAKPPPSFERLDKKKMQYLQALVGMKEFGEILHKLLTFRHLLSFETFPGAGPIATAQEIILSTFALTSLKHVRQGTAAHKANLKKEKKNVICILIHQQRNLSKRKLTSQHQNRKTCCAWLHLSIVSSESPLCTHYRGTHIWRVKSWRSGWSSNDCRSATGTPPYLDRGFSPNVWQVLLEKQWCRVGEEVENENY